MSKEYRRYRGDFGHEWVLFRDEQDPEQESERICPEGHQVITKRREKAIDDTQVTFRPAGRIVDPVKGQELMRGRYYVVLSNMDSSQELVTKSTFSWDEACQFAQRFDKRPFEWTLKQWDKLAV